MNNYSQNLKPVKHGSLIASLFRSDLGQAEVMATMFKDSLAFDINDKRWYLFNQDYWDEDISGQIWNLVGRNLAGEYEQAAGKETKATKEEGDEHAVNADRLRRIARSLRTRRNVKPVLSYAENQFNLYVENKVWDADPMAIACPNGVISLKDGSISSGKPGDYIRTVIPSQYDGLKTKAPRFEKFLLEIFNGDVDLIEFVQRLFGYGITGSREEAVLPIFTGRGRNGKDTLLQAIENTLGLTLAGPTHSEILLGNSAPGTATPYIYDLRFKRLVYINETSDGATLNAAQVKWLTGASTLVGRPLHGNPITFTPQHLLVLITNHKPQAPSGDYALWQRVKLVEFDVSFIDDPLKPNERQVDRKLVHTLRSEASGILAWLVRGCLDWQSEGLACPESVKFATEQYRKGEDTFKRFLSDCAVKDSKNAVKSSAIHTSYEVWTESKDLRPLRKMQFYKAMALKFEKERKNDGWYYLGIGLKPSNEAS